MPDADAVIRDLFQIKCDPNGPLPYSTGRRYGNRNLFPELCKQLGYEVGAEIGVKKGEYSELFCQVGIRMHCVDPWQRYFGIDSPRIKRYYREAVARLGKYGDKANIIRSPSVDAVGCFDDESLDFVYIDGDHAFDAAMMDLLLYVPKVRPGGLIMAHDYHGECRGVMLAVDAYVQAHHVDPWYVLKAREPTVFWIKR